MYMPMGSLYAEAMFRKNRKLWRIGGRRLTSCMLVKSHDMYSVYASLTYTSYRDAYLEAVDKAYLRKVGGKVKIADMDIDHYEAKDSVGASEAVISSAGDAAAGAASAHDLVFILLGPLPKSINRSYGADDDLNSAISKVSNLSRGASSKEISDALNALREREASDTDGGVDPGYVLPSAGVAWGNVAPILSAADLKPSERNVFAQYMS